MDGSTTFSRWIGSERTRLNELAGRHRRTGEEAGHDRRAPRIDDNSTRQFRRDRIMPEHHSTFGGHYT
jgi:hypothetical protein